VPLSVRFHQLQPWAIPPSKIRIDRSAARQDADLYRESFRYIRAERRAEHCSPWVMGQELGWRVQSPVDITFTELDQIEVDVDTDPEVAAKVANRSELWNRDRSHLAVSKTSWLHLYQFSTARGWENMFMPNGAGTVEWRLGWAMDLPRGYFLLVLPCDPPGLLPVPTGVMSSTTTTRMSAAGGMSIAVHPPAGPVTIRRGQEIAASSRFTPIACRRSRSMRPRKSIMIWRRSDRAQPQRGQRYRRWNSRPPHLPPTGPEVLESLGSPRSPASLILMPWRSTTNLPIWC
jgi:hypothetical protein